MDSIRGSKARSSLRKTKGPELKSLRARLGYESSRCNEFGEEEDESRRKVTLDPNTMDSLLNFSEDEDDESVTFSRQTSCESTTEDPPKPVIARKDSVDSKKHRRRHSLTVCETPTRSKPVEIDQEDEMIERTLRHRGRKVIYGEPMSLFNLYIPYSLQEPNKQQP